MKQAIAVGKKNQSADLMTLVYRPTFCVRQRGSVYLVYTV